MSNESVSIPDEDIENMLQKVVLNDEEYLIGKTGNVYHRDKKFIIGVIQDWDDMISKDELKTVNMIPVLGYDRLKDINKIVPKRKFKRRIKKRVKKV